MDKIKKKKKRERKRLLRDFEILIQFKIIIVYDEVVYEKFKIFK